MNRQRFLTTLLLSALLLTPASAQIVTNQGGTSGGGGSGTVTSITVEPGLTTVVGTQNTGAAITTTGSVYPQIWPVNVSSSCTVNSNCNGAVTNETGELLIATAGSVTLTFPNPSSGTKGSTYAIGSDGTHFPTLATVGGSANFYGDTITTSGATTFTPTIATDFQIVDTGTAYKVVGSNDTQSAGSGNALFGTTTGNTANDFVSMSNTTVGVKDSGYAIGTSGAAIPLLNGTNVWSGQQSNSVTTLSISTTTFTPTGANNNYKIVLTSACASAACTLANPSATPVAGTSGVIEVVQPASGGPAAFGTYGSSYIYAGGTSTITYSTGANAIDAWSYYVIDSTHILLSIGALNATH